MDVGKLKELQLVWVKYHLCGIITFKLYGSESGLVHKSIWKQHCLSKLVLPSYTKGEIHTMKVNGDHSCQDQIVSE